jgi:hypothetical protein
MKKVLVLVVVLMLVMPVVVQADEGYWQPVTCKVRIVGVDMWMGWERPLQNQVVYFAVANWPWPALGQAITDEHGVAEFTFNSSVPYTPVYVYVPKENAFPLSPKFRMIEELEYVEETLAVVNIEYNMHSVR